MQPGTKVRLKQSNRDGSYKLTEAGIVIHVWYNEFLDSEECYVAFFGNDFPEENSKCEKPYILKYLIGSLECC